jgi:hypothetical protein
MLILLSSIALSTLETVSSLTIVTDPSWKPTPRAPLRIHLASLREAGWMSIRGYVSRLETPELTTLGTQNNAETEQSGMEIHTNYMDLEGVELGALERLYGELVLEGFISGYGYFPSSLSRESHHNIWSLLLTLVFDTV